MKKYISFFTFFAVAVTVLPAFTVYAKGGAKENKSPHISEYISDEENSYSFRPYKVLDHETGEINEISVREYIIGSVCAEMPATFEENAIMAQAVTAHTYAERQRINHSAVPDPELKGADFSTDFTKYQAYLSQEEIKQFYGDNFDEYYKKVCSCVDSVLNYIITYQNEPIISAFHSMSSGRTESAENVWGTKVDYLIPVDSISDTSAPKYLEETRFTKEVLKEKLEENFNGIQLEDDFTQWIKPASISDSFTVLTAAVGNLTVTGNEIRQALGLRSSCFEVSYEGDEAVITTRGYGHNVGMSQYGADSMAKSGSSWQEILLHYYPECEITEI